MASKRELLGNELMTEIVRIRIDTLWSMLALRRAGRFPATDTEKSTGLLDDKGALFMPGGFVFEDWEGNAIKRQRLRDRSATGFRKAVREAMRYDGVHLLYPDGIASRVKLGNTGFARIATNILENKREALRRRSGLGERRPARISSAHICRSYCPTYIPAPYGSRTSLSSDISVCLVEPRMYFRQCEAYYSLREDEAETFWQGIDEARRPILGKDGEVLAAPYLVTCHNTRYREEIFTGITRITGFGKFGELATLTLELATTELLHETDSARTAFTDDEIVARFDDTQIACVLRIYPRTNPGARLQKGISASLVLPEKDLGIDLERVTAEAWKRYNVT